MSELIGLLFALFVQVVIGGLAVVWALNGLGVELEYGLREIVAAGTLLSVLVLLTKPSKA